jgi:hypothetical protein
VTPDVTARVDGERMNTIAQLQADARIHGRCPSCERVFPLRRALLFYADAPLPEAARSRRAARRADLRARATWLDKLERGRRALPRLLIFDGMNAAGAVRRIVLFDGPALGHARERVQRSIQRALEAGNYEWRTVRMGKDGRIQPERRRDAGAELGGDARSPRAIAAADREHTLGRSESDNDSALQRLGKCAERLRAADRRELRTGSLEREPDLGSVLEGA